MCFMQNYLLYLKIKNNWNNPKKPRAGYSRFNNFEKPIGAKRILKRQIINADIKYVDFFFIFKFCKKQYPLEIHVVSIEILITKP